jgi:nucleoside-diphosphate-sugar epimerase
VTVLLSGATGFIGTALLRRLLLAGSQVRATFHRAPGAVAAGVQWWPLESIDSAAAWRELVSGCDTVVHLAALVHQTGAARAGRWSEFQRINVAGTRALAEACAAAAVQRLVFVSSVAAVCARSDVVVTERTPARPEDDYGRSKLESERALQSVLLETAVDWCIVRPPLVYGPGNPGNISRLMKLIASGLPLPFGAIHNRRSFIFVDNLADALQAAVCHPTSIRDTFLLNDGSDFSTPELVRALATATGGTAHLLSLSPRTLRLLGRVGDLLERALGVSTGIDSYSIERLLGSLPVSGAHFRQVFSWTPPVDVSAALALTCASPRSHA